MLVADAPPLGGGGGGGGEGGFTVGAGDTDGSGAGGDAVGAIPGGAVTCTPIRLHKAAGEPEIPHWLGSFHA